MKVSGNATKPRSEGDSSPLLAVFMRVPSRIIPDTDGEKSTGRMEQLSKDSSSWVSKMVRDGSGGLMAELLKVCMSMGRGRDMECDATQTDRRTQGSGARTRSTDMGSTRVREGGWLGPGSTTF